MPADLLTRTQLLSGSLANANTTPIVPLASATISGSGVDLGAGGALPAGSAIVLVARIVVIDLHETSGGGTITFTISHSSDNSTFAVLAGSSRGANDVLTMSATVQTAEIFIGFYTHQRYIRLDVTTGAGTLVGTSLTFDAQLMPSYP